MTIKMQQEWVLDVITDLKAFARQNGMRVLAEQLDDTLIVAAAELSVAFGAKQRAGHDADFGETDQRPDIRPVS